MKSTIMIQNISKVLDLLLINEITEHLRFMYDMQVHELIGFINTKFQNHICSTNKISKASTRDNQSDTDASSISVFCIGIEYIHNNKS